MRDAYHPDTLEHIPTDTPADWMLRAGVSAPAYNPATAGCFFQNGAWAIVQSGMSQEELSAAKTKAAYRINAECAAAITVGFTSSALGTPHSYTCTLEDQANLLALIYKGAGGSFTCVDAAGAKARRAHTAAQLQTLLDDGQAHKEPRLDKARALKDRIEAIQPSATAVAEVGAVVWVFP